MNRRRLAEAEQAVAAVDLEAGDQKGDDQRGLRPVPEALEALEKIDAFSHFRAPCVFCA